MLTLSNRDARRFLLAGAYRMEKPTLERFRAVVDKRGERLQALLDELVVGDYEQYLESYARVPKGFAHDHPHAELLKYKNLAVVSPLMPPAQVTRAAFLDDLTALAAHLAPLVAWMDEELG